MNTTVKKVTLMEQQSTATNDSILMNETYLNVVGDVKIDCLVRLGTVTVTINELRQLKKGEVLSLHEKPYEPVDVLLNNQVIARGELMTCDDCFAIQITEITTE